MLLLQTKIKELPYVKCNLPTVLGLRNNASILPYENEIW